MAGFDDIAKKATEFLKSEKAQKALKSEKGERMTDKLLDGAAGIAGKVTGGKHDDSIEKARKAADEKLGRDGGAAGGTRPDTTPRPQ